MKTKTIRSVSIISRVAMLALATSFLVACPVVPPEDLTIIHGSDTVGGDPYIPTQYVTSVVVSGSTDLALGASEQLSITVTYNDNTTSTDVNVAQWYSTNDSVLTVSAGNVTAVAAGTAAIYAIAEGVTSNYFYLNIAAKPVSTVVIAGSTALSLGGTEQLTILITYTDSSTSTEVGAAAWYSSNSDILTVGISTGNLSAVGVGPATIYAVAGGVTSNYLEFTIQPAGVELDCGTTLMAGASHTCQLWGLNGTSTRTALITSGWSMTATNGRVSVDGANITAFGTADGTETLNATYSGTTPALTDSTTIDVVHVNGLTIAVSGSCATTALVSGSTCTYTATPTRSGGGTVPTELVNSILWSSPLKNNVIVTSSEGATGTIQASVIGNGNLKASLGAVDSNVVTFTTKPSSVVLSNDAFTIAEGAYDTVTFQAKNSSSANVTVDAATATVSWSSSGTGFNLDGTVDGATISGVTASTGGQVWVTINTVQSNHAGVTITSVRQAPTFGGLTSAVLSGDNTSVTLGWAAATDSQTTVGLLYQIYYVAAPTAFSFTGPPVTTVTFGNTGTTIVELTRGAAYTFGVCAIDASSNRYCGSGTPPAIAGPSITVAIPSANPTRTNSVLYVDVTGRHIFSFDRAEPATITDLGSVLFGTPATIDVTAPMFMPDGRIIGIGQARDNLQTVYIREANGTFGTVGSSFTVNTGGRGVSTPGSARAFALSDGRIAFTKSGTSNATVNLFMMNANGTNERQAPLNDIERVAPTTDGRIAVIWYGNIYLLTPPADLSNLTQSFGVRPITIDSAQTGLLLFGRKATGPKDTVVTIDQGSGTVLNLVVYDVTTTGTLTATPATASTSVRGFAGGFVESNGTGLWAGPIVIHHEDAVTPTMHTLYEVDPEANTVTQLVGTFGRASVDTAR